MKRTAQTAMAFLLSMLAVSVATHSASISLSPVADTTLFENSPDNNLGASTSLAVGTTAGLGGPPARSRALVRFDLAGRIPTNATISTVSLSWTVTKIPSPTKVDSTFAIHRILRPWREGAGTGDLGAPAKAGEASWNLPAGPRGTENLPAWSLSGGSVGEDFSTTPSSTVAVTGLGRYSFQTTEALVADVQSWIDHPESNHGWALLTLDEESARTARRLASRESGNPEHHPRLVIEFFIPAEKPPFAMESVEKLPGGFQFKFTAEAGKNHTVEFATRIPVETWNMLTNFPATPAPQEIIIMDGSMTNNPLRFYRVRKE